MDEIYTDGSCLGNPGRGGWAAISKDFKICGAQPNTTNNIMEMTAILRALDAAFRRDEKCVRIFTDSNYTKQGITSWIRNWKKNGWKTSSGSDVKNRELWIELDKIRDCFTMIEWRWVKAHNGDPKNEEVDKLARECAKNLSV